MRVIIDHNACPRSKKEAETLHEITCHAMITLRPRLKVLPDHAKAYLRNCLQAAGVGEVGWNGHAEVGTGLVARAGKQ